MGLCVLEISKASCIFFRVFRIVLIMTIAIMDDNEDYHFNRLDSISVIEAVACCHKPVVGNLKVMKCVSM